MGFKDTIISAWTVDDVQQWLDEIGLPALKEQFKINASELQTKLIFMHV